MKNHLYKVAITWTGNTGSGTKSYRSYKRDYVVNAAQKHQILGSSDPAFLGDASRYSPEDQLVASVSACHMLWYLHVCTNAGIIVSQYEDHAEGTMVETDDGSGYFSQIILKPIITIHDLGLIDKANECHREANKFCFVANSCNFPILHQPTYKQA